MFATRSENVNTGEVEGEAPHVPPAPLGKEDVDVDQQDEKEVEQQQEEKEGEQQEEKEEESPTEPEEEEPEDIMPRLLEGKSHLWEQSQSFSLA